MRDRDPGVGRRRDPRRDRRHDFERHAGGHEGLGFLAATAEDERVATLEPHDALAAAGELDQEGVDGLLLHRWLPGLLPDVVQLGVRRSFGDETGGDQAVVHDRIRFAYEFERTTRDKPGVAGPRAY